jgi:hypothetical protein
MADDLIQVNNNKENVIEFDLRTEGLNPDDINATFVIRSAEMDLSFPCKKDANGKWTAKLPALPMLERTAYPYYLSIVSEGYHFQPVAGEVHVIGSADVYVSSVKTKLAAPTPKKVPVQERKTVVGKEMVTPKSQPTKSREKGIAQIATELTESKKPKKVEVKAPPLAANATTVEKKEPPKVVKPAPIIETGPILENRIEIEPKKVGEKDKAVRSILQELGVVSEAKAHKTFTVLDALKIQK